MQDYDEDYIDNVYGGFINAEVKDVQEDEDEVADSKESSFDFKLIELPKIENHYDIPLFSLLVACLISSLAVWHLLDRYSPIKLSFLDCLLGVSSVGWLASLLLFGEMTINATGTVMLCISVFFSNLTSFFWTKFELARYPFKYSGLSFRDKFILAQVCCQIRKSPEIADWPDFFDSLSVLPSGHNLPKQVHDYFVKKNENRMRKIEDDSEDDSEFQNAPYSILVGSKFAKFLLKKGLSTPTKSVTLDEMENFVLSYDLVDDEKKKELCENLGILKD